MKPQEMQSRDEETASVPQTRGLGLNNFVIIKLVAMNWLVAISKIISQYKNNEF